MANYSEETITDKVMDSILYHFGIDGLESVEYFSDTQIHLDFGENDGCYIITIEEE